MSLKHDWFKLQVTKQLPTEFLPWLNATNLKAFATKVEQLARRAPQIGVPQAVAGAELARLATTFHSRAGTNTSAVSDALKHLIDNAPILRCTHQPNLFPSLNVLSQSVAVSQLAQHLQPAMSLPPVQVFFLLDYDVAGDSRFRVAHFPSPKSRDGFLAIRIPFSRDYDNQPMFSLPRPSSEWLELVFSQLRALVDQEFVTFVDTANDRGQLQHNLTRCHEIAQDALRTADTLTEFNSTFISLLSNLYWELPLIFIPGHQALRMVVDHFEFLWDATGEIFRAKIEAAELLAVYGFPVKSSLIGSRTLLNFWFLCHCGERLPVISKDSSFTTITARCEKCGNEYQYTKQRRESFRDLVREGRVLPRVVADNLFDVVAWNFHAGGNYVGSAEHYLFSIMVALRLGLTPLPEFLWSVKDSFQSDKNPFTQDILNSTLSREQPEQLSSAIEHVRNGSASCLFYLTMKSLKEVLSAITVLLPNQESNLPEAKLP